MKRLIVLTCGVIILVSIGVLPRRVRAQSPTDTPAPAIVTATPDFSTMVSKLNTGLDTLVEKERIVNESLNSMEDRVSDLEDTRVNGFLEIVDRFKDYIVVFALLLFLFWSKKPIFEIIENLANSEKTSVKMFGGELQWTKSDLAQAIVEREILKFGILLAVADKNITQTEMEYLAQKASTMSNLEKLRQDDRNNILKEALIMASVDKVIQSEEYVTFMHLASQFNVSISDIDNMIVEHCILAKLKPPPQLEAKFEQRMRELERSR